MTTAPSHRPTGFRPAAGPRAARPQGPTRGAVGGFTTSIDPLRVLRRHIWLLVAATVGGSALGVGAFVFLNREYPMYTGTVLFEMQAALQDPQQLGAQEIAREDLVARLANTETALLTNRIVLTRAVSHPDVLRTRWGSQFVLSGGGIAADDAVDDLLNRLSASVIRGTNLFRISWSTRHASDVPVVLNRIKDAYLDRRRSSEDAVWSDNIRLFERELDRTTGQIEEAEREIGEFIRRHGIQSLDDPRYHQKSIEARQVTEQITSITSTLNMSEVALQQVELKLLGTLEPDSEERLEAEHDPVVRFHSQQIAQMKTHRRVLSETLQPGHPAIADIERKIRAAEIERDVKMQEIIRRNLEAKHKNLRDSVERHQKLLTDLQREADEIDMHLRELAAHQAHYRALETRRQRLEAQRESDRTHLDQIRLIRTRADAARVRVVQDALQPRQKSFPKPQIIIPLGALLAVFLTLGVIFLREVTDQRIKSASDLAVVPSTCVLGVIPDIDDDPTAGRSNTAELMVRHHPLSVLAESYRQACAVLGRAIERNAHQTILFLSGLPGAGTTTAVSNIAASLAATGRSVLVVDANFRRPHLAEAMGAPATGPGLGDLLAETATIDEALVESDCGVSVIPAGTPANRVIERLNNGNFESIVAELRGRFDLILFDAPPAVVAGDAMVLANRLDAAVLVVRANQEQKGLVARIVSQLADARCESLGVLLNRPRGTAGGYFKKNYETMAKYSRK